MKHFVIKALALCLFALSISITAHSQVSGNVRYKDIKDLYDISTYDQSVDDRYQTGWAALASFLVPGLGQGLCDEWGRTLGIWAGNLGFYALDAVGVGLIYRGTVANEEDYDEDAFIPNGWVAGGLATILASVVGQVSFNIWNVVDALKVAKTKNMYYRDVSLGPKLSFAPTAGGGMQPTVGAGITVTC